MVMEMSLYSLIWEAYISGESQRSIARRLGVSRQTVRSATENERSVLQHFPYNKALE